MGTSKSGEKASASCRMVKGSAGFRTKIIPEQFAEGRETVCVSKNGKTPVTASDVY